jgi:hypothetical protein
MDPNYLELGSTYAVATKDGLLDQKATYYGVNDDKFIFILSRNTIAEVFTEKQVKERVCKSVPIPFKLTSHFSEGDFVINSEGDTFVYIEARELDKSVVRTLDGKTTIVDNPLWFHPVYRTLIQRIK